MVNDLNFILIGDFKQKNVLHECDGDDGSGERGESRFSVYGAGGTEWVFSGTAVGSDGQGFLLDYLAERCGTQD